MSAVLDKGDEMTSRRVTQPKRERGEPLGDRVRRENKGSGTSDKAGLCYERRLRRIVITWPELSETAEEKPVPVVWRRN